MAALNYPVVGVPKQTPAPADGSVGVRRELRDLKTNYPDQFTLYILGLQALMNRPATSDLSYYGIAGIHGRPYRSWGGSRQNNPSGWQGYCTHSSILFAPWHRPYLALFEQNLYEEVNKAANLFPTTTRARYQAAARSFRVPYWDWAANPPAGETFFPRAISDETVSIVTPQSDGKVVRVTNPLFAYQFKPLNPNGADFANLRGTPYDKWPTTLRYPTNVRAVDAKSNQALVEPAAATQAASLQGDVYVLLNDPSYKTLEAFSSNEWHQPTRSSRSSRLGSIEDLHGNIHSCVGGPMGHMSQLQYSAFDPIFWLHHANIDRLFAIWQAMNPQAYEIDKEEVDGTFSIAGGTMVNQNTPLPPFNDASGRKYWTSSTARTTEAFNYVYPETQRWRYSSNTEYVSSIRTTVFNLYGGISRLFQRGGSSSRVAAISSRVADSGTDAATNPQPISQAAAPAQRPLAENVKPQAASTTAPVAATKPVTAKLQSNSQIKEEHHSFLHNLGHSVKTMILGNEDDNKDRTRGGIDFEAEIGKPGEELEAQDSSYIEYICTLKGPKHILQQTYIVHVFLGEFSPETNSWPTESSLVGTFTVFGKALTTGCEKCARDAEAELEVSGTVNLTKALINEMEEGRLGSVERENVLPFLRRNLHWRVTLADGTEQARDEVPHLKVGVVSTIVNLPAGELPEFSGQYIIHTEVTEGRPAGLNPSPTTAPPVV